MKILIALLSALFLVACSNAESDAVEEPTRPESEISVNNNVIESFEENIAADEKRIEEADSETLADIYRESIEDWENEIELKEAENEILEETLVYNDEFRVIQGTALYAKQHEGILNESTLVSGFHRDMIATLDKYEGKFSNGAFMIAAVPFSDEEEKMPVITLFFEQDTLDRLDLEKATDDEDSRYLYEEADYLGVYSVLSEELQGHGDISVIPKALEGYLFMMY